MRGQRLFVRPIESADSDHVRSFLERHERPRPVDRGLLGKLVGDLVAVLAIHITDDGIQIDDLVVTKELRKKQIGRAMLRELDVLAADMKLPGIIVNDPGSAAGFFEHVGFVVDGEQWTRRVGGDQPGR